MWGEAAFQHQSLVIQTKQEGGQTMEFNIVIWAGVEMFNMYDSLFPRYHLPCSLAASPDSYETWNVHRSDWCECVWERKVYFPSLVPSYDPSSAVSSWDRSDWLSWSFLHLFSSLPVFISFVSPHRRSGANPLQGPAVSSPFSISLLSFPQSAKSLPLSRCPCFFTSSLLFLSQQCPSLLHQTFLLCILLRLLLMVSFGSPPFWVLLQSAYSGTNESIFGKWC